MLITSAASALDVEALVVRVPGLPDFNDSAGGPLRARNLAGWYNTAAPDAVLVANGGGAGAVAAGEWLYAEAYYVLEGSIVSASRAEMESLRALLLRGLPPTGDVSLKVLGGVVDKQIFVRTYDVPNVEQIAGRKAQFTIPLVAPDPYKYALEPLAGTFGTFTGQRWFREYAESAGKWVRTYAQVGGKWVRTYEQTATDGPFPSSLTLDSPGDAVSRRLTIDVIGPLTAGDWFVENLATGERMWAEVSVTAGQTLTFDCRARTARLSGASVDHLAFGDYLTLAPGSNTYRLSVGSASDAHATVTALPAYL